MRANPFDHRRTIGFKIDVIYIISAERICPTPAKINKEQFSNPKRSISHSASTMEVLELKREIETLSSRLGKTQDYL
ncbi:hypothetical protein [Nostoc sp.]|uniref:hypothetical protein n=1 Tax=Nostoc sp. TaxID=1180 RepID=UPI002FF6A6C4